LRNIISGTRQSKDRRLNVSYNSKLSPIRIRWNKAFLTNIHCTCTLTLGFYLNFFFVFYTFFCCFYLLIRLNKRLSWGSVWAAPAFDCRLGLGLKPSREHVAGNEIESTWLGLCKCNNINFHIFIYWPSERQKQFNNLLKHLSANSVPGRPTRRCKKLSQRRQSTLWINIIISIIISTGTPDSIDLG